MDPELLELLARIGNESNPLTDDELAALEAGLVEVAGSVEPASATAEEIELLAEAATAVEEVRGEIAARAEAAESRASEARELLERITPPADPAATAEADPPPSGGETGPAVEADPALGDGETAGADGGETESSVDPAAEPVAAAGNPPGNPGPHLPSISRLAQRRPARNRPQPTATVRVESDRAALVASTDLPGLPSGVEVPSLDAWAYAAAQRIDTIMKDRRETPREKVYLGTIKAAPIPEERILDLNERSNAEKIEAVRGTKALAASGGVCGPVGVDYTVTTIAAADRPAKSATAQFGASRGGLRYILPQTFAQVTTDGPSAIWTETTDATPGGNTKPHATFSCQSVQEQYVDAVTSIVQFGNFQARYFPEQISQFLETVDAVHSRLADANILAAISAGSTSQTNADTYELGAARDFLATIDRAAAAFRYRNRMNPTAPLRLVYPAFLNDMIRADLVRQLPGDSGGQTERFATSDAEIAGWLTVRGINSTPIWDSYTQVSGSGTLQGWGAQGSGQLEPWPLVTTCWLFHEGAWMFLDGGELNLGMVRDSTLNRTNDFQMFSETFEKTIFRGHESVQLSLKIAPTGASAGTVSTSAGGETIGS